MQIDKTPAIVQEIATLVGDDAATRLVERFGGLDVLFKRGASEVSALIGSTNALVLFQHFAGTPVHIPMCVAYMKRRRNESILREFDVLTKDMSARKAVACLARKHRLGERTVWGLLKKPAITD